MATNKQRLAKLEKAAGNLTRPDLTIIYNGRDYYRLAPGPAVNYRQMLTGEGAQPIDAAELPELGRRYNLTVVSFTDDQAQARHD